VTLQRRRTPDRSNAGDGLPRPFSVVTVGPLDWIQGLEYALLAVHHYLEMAQDIRFDIVSYGGCDRSERQRILYTIEGLRLCEHVLLSECSTLEEMRKYLGRADVFMQATA
jgi:hypothetical protein